MDDTQFRPYHRFVEKRPWGLFTQYTHNQRTTVKIIEVAPGGKLSIQKHQRRDELWVILSPYLCTSIDGAGLVRQVGDEVWVPRGTVHSIENRGSETGKFLEIAFGEFDEKDIERLQDIYGRK